ncbi:MAG: hypothetical protein JKY31_10260 [Rhodobacteraceae bacterium]|nr:hypothetical protein [Paracoccaceae bacterium]
MKQLFSLIAGGFAAAMLFASASVAQVQVTADDLANAPNCARYPTAQESYLCQCPTGFLTGSAWGSGPYTADSNICTAAVHSGVISMDGGTVVAFIAPGQTSYSGSPANGISTSNWGAYGDSIIVEAAQSEVSLPACVRLPSGVDDYTCSCSASTGSNGGVWGSGPYTTDSNICAAARHAGYIGDEAGDVKVLRIPGLNSYMASEWNGVSSSNWGTFSSSIVFNGN